MPTSSPFPSRLCQGCDTFFESDNGSEVRLPSLYGCLNSKGETTHSYFQEKDIQTFETASAVFRLGTKYGIDYLRGEAQRRFTAQYPSSLHSHATGAGRRLI